MKSNVYNLLHLSAAVVIANALWFAPRGLAAPLYSESFDSAASAMVLERKLANSESFYVDYSAIVRNQAGSGGPVTIAIPEAPNRIAGSLATRGVLLDIIYPNTTANRTINLLAATAPGGPAMVFNGDYRMAFDMWLAMDPAALFGTTEVGLFGIGQSGTNTMSYARRASGVGTFGWASTEGGIGRGNPVGTNGDIGLHIGGTGSFFTEDQANSATYLLAFPHSLPFDGTPVNQWTQVELYAVGGKVSVYMNGLKFGETTTSPVTDGAAVIGYEDPFAGATSYPSATSGGSPLTNRQFGLFDNFTVDSLSGVPVLEAAPATVLAAVTAPDTTSSGAFSVANTSADTTYQITSAAIDGAHASNFTLPDVFPIQIPPLEAVSVSVVFNPTVPNGLKVARLRLTTTDPNRPVISLPLQGQRAVPSVLATVTTRIVSVAIAGGTGNGVLSIANNGPTTVTLTNPVLGGADAAMFAVNAIYPLEIPSMESVDLPITFTPFGVSGLKSATLSLNTTDTSVPMLTANLLSRYAFGPPLLAHYKMDDAAGTSLVDATGVSPAAGLQIREAPFGFQQASLLPGGAGTSVRLIAAENSTVGNFAISNAVHLPNVSYSMWIKPEAKAGKRTLLHRSSLFTTVGTLYALYLTPTGKLVFEINSATAVESAEGAIPDDVVSHIAVTHSDLDAFGNTTATRTRLFINGVMVAETAPVDPEVARGYTDYNLNTTSAGLYMGTTTSAGSTGYTGLLDDLQIYSVELTADQIAGIFSQPGKTAFNLETLDYRITAIQYNPGTGAITLTWNSAAGAVYSVQESTVTSGFTDVSGQTGIPSGGVTTSTTFPAGAGPRRFFQIRRTSPP